MSTLNVIDGSGFIFRAFYALPPMMRPDGVQVNAVFGFCTMLLKLLTEKPDVPFIVAFDHERKTFRHDIYPEYKAHRPALPVELIPQFALIREACDAFSVPQLEQPGFEADDIIATLAHRAHTNKTELCIIGSDKDLMQLIGGPVSMFDPTKHQVVTQEDVEKKFGVAPEKVVDVQALCGDSTDNIQGVPGIGIKTASLLIQTFGTLEHLLNNTHNIPQKKRRQLLEEYAPQARLSKKLVTLNHDVPLTYNLSDFKRHPILTEKFCTFLKAQNFKQLLERVQQQYNAAPSKTKCHLIQTKEAFSRWAEKVPHTGVIALAIEDRKEGSVLSFSHKKFEEVRLILSSPKEIIWITHVLKPLLEDPKILKIGHDVKKLIHLFGRPLCPIDDTIVMLYILEGGVITSKTLNEIAKEQNIPYASHNKTDPSSNADLILRLYSKLKQRLVKEKLCAVYERIDRPLIHVLAHMESRGILLDDLKDQSALFEKECVALEKEIFALAGESFNIGSPKQLGHILFDKMKFIHTRKGKSGTYSTGADVLEKLSLEGHLLPKKILRWRTLSKLKSTYTDALPHQRDLIQGAFIHTSHKQPR